MVENKYYTALFCHFNQRLKPRVLVKVDAQWSETVSRGKTIKTNAPFFKAGS